MTDALMRILLVDDETLVRRGMGALLSGLGGFEVVGEAPDNHQAISAAQALHPDVILYRPLLPGSTGSEAIERILSGQPGARLLVIPGCSSLDQILGYIRAGALGCLSKDADPRDLAQAIRALHRGEPWLAPVVARHILHEMRHPQPMDPGPLGAEHLTGREAVVLGLLAQGMGNQAIAGHLRVSEATVRTHVSHILRKLHLGNRVQAVLFALRHGVVSSGDDLRGGLIFRPLR